MGETMDTFRMGAFAIIALLAASAAQAGEIVRWVDADGVVHFGDRQAAPSQGSETVQLRSANSMDAPDTSVLRQDQQAQVVKLKRPQRENERGWRGYESRSKARRSERYGSN